MKPTRSVNLVKVSSNSRLSPGSGGTCGVAVYVDSALKGIVQLYGIYENASYNPEVKAILEAEGCSAGSPDRLVVTRVEYASRYFQESCCSNLDIFREACPTLLQHLPRD